MWTLELDRGRFYVFRESTGCIETLSALSLIGAYQEAVRFGYEMNDREWINEGARQPILFSTEVRNA